MFDHYFATDVRLIRFKGSINSRVNILYFLDSLCETCLLAKSHPNSLGVEGSTNGSFYVDFVARDLQMIIECVVPEGRQGLPNLTSTKQVCSFTAVSHVLHFITCILKILENWRSKRVIDPQKIDDVMTTLMNRRKTTVENPESTTSHSQALSRNDIFKRIEEDRERHKRLRERRWVQPVAHNPSTYLPPQLASFMPLTDDGDGEGELTIDIEFENEWETTSDWNEDDDDAAREENELCFARAGLTAQDADGVNLMDLS